MMISAAGRFAFASASLVIAVASVGCASSTPPPDWVVAKQQEASEGLKGYPRTRDIPTRPTDARTARDWSILMAELKAIGVALEDIRPAPGDPLEANTEAYIAEVRRRARAAAAAADPIAPPPDLPPPPER